MSRTASGSDINEKNYSIFFPLEKLSKVSFVCWFNLSPSVDRSTISGFFNFFRLISDFASQNSARMQHKWHSTGNICGLLKNKIEGKTKKPEKTN